MEEDSKIITSIISAVVVTAVLAGGVIYGMQKKRVDSLNDEIKVLEEKIELLEGENTNTDVSISICDTCVDKFPEKYAIKTDDSLDWSPYETGTPEGVYLRVWMPGKITWITKGSVAGGPNHITFDQTPKTLVKRIIIEKLPKNINQDNLLNYLSLNNNYGYNYSLLEKFSLDAVGLPGDAVAFLVSRTREQETVKASNYNISAAILISSHELIEIWGTTEQDKDIFKEIIQKVQIGFSSR